MVTHTKHIDRAPDPPKRTGPEAIDSASAAGGAGAREPSNLGPDAVSSLIEPSVPVSNSIQLEPGAHTREIAGNMQVSAAGRDPAAPDDDMAAFDEIDARANSNLALTQDETPGGTGVEGSTTPPGSPPPDEQEEPSPAAKVSASLHRCRAAQCPLCEWFLRFPTVVLSGSSTNGLSVLSLRQLGGMGAARQRLSAHYAGGGPAINGFYRFHRCPLVGESVVSVT